jgi:hypothetical protein
LTPTVDENRPLTVHASAKVYVTAALNVKELGHVLPLLVKVDAAFTSIAAAPAMVMPVPRVTLPEMVRVFVIVRVPTNPVQLRDKPTPAEFITKLPLRAVRNTSSEAVGIAPTEAPPSVKLQLVVTFQLVLPVFLKYRAAIRT